MNAASPTDEPIRAALHTQGAISRAWHQVSPAELAAMLLLMPTKIRNRMLSTHRTPLSKVTEITARLLVTNLGRGSLAERRRAADRITSPLMHRLGDAVDDTYANGNGLDPIAACVAELADDFGPTMVVLAAVAGLTAEPDRFAPALVAAGDAGYLSGELAEMAATARPLVEESLAVAAVAAEALRTSAAGDLAPDAPGTSSGDLREQWTSATEATARIDTAVAEGRTVAAEDISAVMNYSAALTKLATELGAEATMGEVQAAETANTTRLTLSALADRLRSLVGPPTLAAALADVHDAAGLIEHDPELTDRLRRFIEIFDSDEPLERFGLASELRSEPAPPDPILLDAALAGLLNTAGLDEASGAEPGHPASWSDSAAQVPATGPSSVADAATEPGADVPLPDGRVDPSASAEASKHPDAHSGAEPESVPATGAENAAAGQHERDQSDDGDLEDAATERPPAGEPATGVSDGDHADGTAGPESNQGAAATDDPTPAAEGETKRELTNGTDDGPPSVPAAAAPPTTADGRPDTDTAKDDVPGHHHLDPEGPAPEVSDEIEPSDEKVGATLTDLVTARRFGLAHHLAAAMGHDYRAAVLGEAALAHVVRVPASPAAAEMVSSVLSTPLNPADIGSVVLRAATTTRVALLDPSSGAPATLRPMVPALQEVPVLVDFVLAVAAATERNLVVPAAGMSVDAAEAHAQAQDIASWAEDTLQRPPRQNRLYRGVEIWKQWIAPDGMLGAILSAVAANNPSRVDEVRRLCAPLGDRRLREGMVDTADKEMREGRGAEPIIGPAREHLLRGVGEIVEQALLWCDSHAGAPGGRSSELRDELASRVAQLRGPIVDEIGAVGTDDWSVATATAAAAMIEETIGLLYNEALQGSELTPQAALNRGLALVEGFELDSELGVLGIPTVAQLVRAASASRAEAFTSRVDAGDFAAAEAIIDLTVGPGDGFEESDARQLLRIRERKELTRVVSLWNLLDSRFAAARSRGRISDEDVSLLQGRLLQAHPHSRDSGERRDLGRVTVELETLARDLEEAAAQRRAVVAADVADAAAAGELNQEWAAKLDDLLDRDELGAVEEYLHRARAGEVPPTESETGGTPDETLAMVLTKHTDGVTAEIVEAARSGGALGDLDFSSVAEIDRASVAEALDAWRQLSGSEHPEDLQALLFPVLRLLGVVPTSLERPQALRQISSSDRWFVDVHGDRSGYAYVPDFGSRAGGRRRLMLCWDDMRMSQMWDLAASNAPANQPAYVLRFGSVPAEARIELARHARRRAGQGQEVVVIDDAVVLCCALAGRQSYDVTMHTVLPYAAPNPYDPDLLAGTPEEMFYGRRSERQKIASPSGSSFISGGRRLGKTALLRSVQAELEGTDVLALLIVIQHVAAVQPPDPAELWPALAARLIDAEVLPEGTEGTADAVSAGVRTWLGDNPTRRLMLLLDECDFFLRADASSSFANVVRLRDLVQYGGGRFKVVFSGLQHVARYRKLPNQPLSQLSQPLVIGPLDASSAAALVRRPLQVLGWAISDAQVDRLVTFCACNPSVIQLACGQLVERLRHEAVEGLAPWQVPEAVLNDLLRSPEVEQGVRDRLFLTLDLDHRYKLLAYLMAWRAGTEGLGVSAAPADLRNQAVYYWPEGFAGQTTDDLRSLCDELVGLGVFAGDAEAGYRMLSPATVRLFGAVEEIEDELLGASENYEPDVAAGAAGNRMSIGDLSDARYSPLTATQLADVVGVGNTQLRVIVGSRALRAESVPDALAAAKERLPGVTVTELTSTSRRQWREAMTAPATGHVVVVSDMTMGRSPESWEQSIDAARRRGHTRTAKGTRSAVLVAGPSERWLLQQVITTIDGRRGDLADVAVGLRRIDLVSLQAWDRIEELDLAHPVRQKRLLAVTGGWPLLVERVMARMRQRPFDDAADELEAHLGTREGAAELIAAVGLDPDDPDQPADPGIVACFNRIATADFRDTLDHLAGLLAIDDDLAVENDPAEAVAILALLGMLSEDDDGRMAAEPVLAGCARLFLSDP